MSGVEPTSGPPAVERAGEPLSLDRLLATYTAWSSADVVDTARRRALDVGDTERASALEAMSSAGPSPVEALAAAHELTSLLSGWRWHTVRAAREAGATWHDIAAATGTDPTTARAEFLDRVERAGEQATAAGFGFRDGQRHRDAATPDLEHATDTDRAAPEGTAMNHDDVQPHHDDEACGRWPVPDPTRPLYAITGRELITRAERDEAVAMTGIGGDPAAAWADLDATRVEAERRAADQPPDSVPAQIAGYISLVSEDHTGALAVEADSWRADLDRTLPLDHAHGEDVAQAAGRLAASVDARMSAEFPADGPEFDGAGFDLERLDEVTERWGYAVFDPDAPGGVRAPSSSEYAELLARLAPSFREDEVDLSDGEVERRWPDAPAAQVDEVARRTADPTFAYDPSAEWGDLAYREPRNQLEADARTAHLDRQRADAPLGPRPELRRPTEVEDALYDAAEQATLADRAHDPDPEAWARYDRMLAVQDLAPLPDQPEGVSNADRGEAAAPPEQVAAGSLRKADDGESDGGRDDVTRAQQRVEAARLRLAAGSAAADPDDTARRAQLSHWDDDHDSSWTGDGARSGDDPLLMRCFGDPEPTESGESGEQW